MLDNFHFFVLIVFTNVTENSNSSSGLSKGALVGIVLGTIAGAVALSAVVTLLILRAHIRKYHAVLGKRRCKYLLFMKLGYSGRYVMIFNFACNCYHSTSRLGLSIRLG